MITCPHCGTHLEERLNDGLASCLKCNSVFENSLFNRLLSASWILRQNEGSLEQLISDTKISEHEAILVYAFISDNLYSHEEFLKVLKLLGIKK